MVSCTLLTLWGRFPSLRVARGTFPTSVGEVPFKKEKKEEKDEREEKEKLFLGLNTRSEFNEEVPNFSNTISKVFELILANVSKVPTQ